MRQLRIDTWKSLLTEAGVDVDPSFLAEHVTWSPWTSDNRFQDEPLPLGNGIGQLCVVGVDSETHFSLRSGYYNTNISREDAVALLRSHKDHVEQLAKREQEINDHLHQSTVAPPLTQGKALNELTTEDIVLLPRHDGTGWELGRVRQVDHNRFICQKADRTYEEVHVYSSEKLRVIDRSGEAHDETTTNAYRQECSDFLTAWNANEAEISAALHREYTDEEAHQMVESSSVRIDDVVLIETRNGRWVPGRVYGVIGANAKLVAADGSTTEVKCTPGQLLRVVSPGPGSRGEQQVNPPGWSSAALGEAPGTPATRERVKIRGGRRGEPLSRAG